MSSLVSIIIPVYNTSVFLDRCLLSVTKQTYRDLEILLIDDGSTDNSGIMCDEWSKKDNRIKVIHQKNKGISAARNTGLKNITGKYVTTIDSDDYLYLNAIEYLEKSIEETSSDVAAYKLKFTFNQKTPKRFPKNSKKLRYFVKEGKAIHEQIFLSMDYQTFFWNKMYRSKTIKGIYLNEDLRCFEDIEGLPRFLDVCKKAVFLNNTLIKYMIRSNSLSHDTSDVKTKLTLLIKLCTLNENRYKEWYPSFGENFHYWWALEYMFIQNDHIKGMSKNVKQQIFFSDEILQQYKIHSKGFIHSPYKFWYKLLYLKLQLSIFFYTLQKKKH